jgi:hypothetical protein
LTLDLQGPREIEQVVVITNPSSEGTYAVSGRTATTDVALR